jgi:restriction system protein
LDFEEIYNKLTEKNKLIRSGISILNPDVKENEGLLLLANSAHYLPTFLRRKYICKIDPDSRIAIIQFEFPDYSDVNIVSGYKKIKYVDHPKYYSETQKKKLLKNCLYSLIIRSAVLAAKYNPCTLYDSVVVNVEQDWFDPATGQPRNGIIATLQASNEYLNSLDLSKLDPESCFKYLKGISTQNVLNSSPVRPIFVLNKEDARFVENKVVDIENDTNLAAMDWEDFEHLVAQLFEWEFAKNGIEVKVTRASRDRGVDAILFDPDPLRGGKYVLQAKRYTRTVDVSAVRDLYGTIMNEGANRGIIITTASFGPDSYEFSKDKPISLVDGQNLLLMLQKHGKKFKIDLEEARQLNIENQR